MLRRQLQRNGALVRPLVSGARIPPSACYDAATRSSSTTLAGSTLPSSSVPFCARREFRVGGSSGGGGGGGSETETFRIGDVSVPIVHGAHPERVPRVPPLAAGFFPPNSSTTLSHLRWMLQKDALRQDMCIIGEPGPARRWLVTLFCHYACKEMQLLTLTRDTTEADIKQRKEIRNGALCYLDQAAVSAAVNGHVLVIDGLERAERNVLPVINNLLENREMHLDNGMMLIHPVRYDQLLAEHKTHDLSHLGLLRVSEHFRVVALTVPVPKYPGNPLDPPLRSRFQCLFLQSAALQNCLWNAIKAGPSADAIMKFKAVLTAADEGGHDRDRARKFADVTDLEALVMARQCALFPGEHLGNIVNRVYPGRLHCLQGARADAASKAREMEALMARYGAKQSASGIQCRAVDVSASPDEPNMADIVFATAGAAPATLRAPRGPNGHLMSLEAVPSSMSFAAEHENLLHALLQSHAAGRSMCLVGPTGCGKTALVREFCALLGYRSETMHLYADMSARDLLQRRTTDPKTGDTAWEPSLLIRAVQEGSVAVLDGIDNLAPGSLAVLQELLVDGCITLLDGSKYVRSEDFERLMREVDLDEAAMGRLSLFRVHPAFRLIATARPPTTENNKKFWLTADVAGLFDFHSFPDLSDDALKQILSTEMQREHERFSDGTSPTAASRKLIATLISISRRLEELNQTDSKMPVLTLRQMLRVTRYLARFPSEGYDAISSALLLSLMSPIAADSVRRVLRDFGLRSPANAGGGGGEPARVSPREMIANLVSRASTAPAAGSGPAGELVATVDEKSGARLLTLNGEVVLHVNRQYSEKELALVPAVFNFYPNVLHNRLLAWLAKVYATGNKILLVGNQGVGKNKIVDYFLHTAQLPRHYVQLHRDTTVGSLTINPTVVDGKVVWEDSPLVKAVTQGHTLVVDEVDKAPVEVVQILKGLIEDGEMTLGDGRQISRWGTPTTPGDGGQEENGARSVIKLHPDFRMIVLANPPGFPFHGNNFYRECGDLFSCLVVQNPDSRSQEDVLVRYAPDVPRPLIAQLVLVFRDLGKLFEEGAIQYPFSLRELINVVKHLQAFPQDGLFQALNNVFNFDAMDPHTLDHVRRLLQEHVKKSAAFVRNQLAMEHKLERVENIMTIKSQAFTEGSPTGSALEVPVGAARLARHDAQQLDHSVESFPMEMTAMVGGRNPGVFTEVNASTQLPFLGDHDTAVGVTMLRGHLVTFLVHTSHPNEASHFRLVSVADPAADIGASTCSLPFGRVSSVILPPTISEKAPLSLIGRLDSFAGGSNDVVLLDASNGNVYEVDPLTGQATISNFYETPTAVHVATPSENAATTRTAVLAVCAVGGNIVHFATAGALLAVTIPDVVEHIHFFGAQLAQLRLQREGECILKLVVTADSARAFIFRIGAKLGGQFVGQLPAPVIAEVGGHSANMELGQAVFVPQTAGDIAFGAVRGAVSGPSGGHSSFVLDGYRLPAGMSISKSVFDPSTNQIVGFGEGGEKVTIIDVAKQTARTFSLPGTGGGGGGGGGALSIVDVGPSGHGVAFDGQGRSLHSFDADARRLLEKYARWAQVMDAGSKEGLTAGPPSPANLEMSYSRPRKKPSGDLKHGKEDEENNPHVGGNQWAGGTGGTDTAGLGGLVGPYRLDKGHKVHQVSPEEKAKVPKEIVDEAKAMGKRALEKRLKEISMSERENAMYMSTLNDVQGQVAQLQLMLNGLKAKEGERVWLKHQTDGVWDDAKIVEGITGEKAIYKRRSDKDNQAFFHHKKKKRLLFVFDVSASMYRFNGYDSRLNRLVECAVMVMESLVGHEEKLEYAIVGHNGDSDHLPLVSFGNPPANKKERMEVCLKMIAYSQYCWRGDNTVAAMRRSVTTVTEQDADSYFVFVISDANLEQYNISPRELSQIILSDARVHMYAIFIASFGGQATFLQQKLPSGHGFECMDTKQLPLVLKRIFTSTNLLG